MKIALSTVAYREARLLPKFLSHIPDWVEKKMVLVSKRPWKGQEEQDDGTESIARSSGADVIVYDWVSEAEQRNAGQDYLSDFDWIVVLDPDEFLDDVNWDILKDCIDLMNGWHKKAFTVNHQRVFWKDKEVFPHTDYKQVILVRPSARFVENRVVNCAYEELPVELCHFSWSRTDEEIKSKINHYSHADELIPNWYEKVWKSNKAINLHPKTPETLKGLIEAKLPPELERLNLWPSQNKT